MGTMSSQSLRVTEEQIAAAQLRIVLDEKLGRHTPNVVRRIAEMTSVDLVREKRASTSAVLSKTRVSMSELTPHPAPHEEPAHEESASIEFKKWLDSEVATQVANVERAGQPSDEPRIGFGVGQHLTVNVAAAFVDGELTATAYERAAEHLTTCQTCAAEVAAQRQARSAVRAVKIPQVPTGMGALHNIHHADQPHTLRRLAAEVKYRVVSHALQEVLRPPRDVTGGPAGPATAFEQLLTDRLRVLGPDHSDTLTTRNNLASWRGMSGDPPGAVTAFEQLLTDRLRVLGPDHSDTLTTRNNLAYWRGKSGDPAGAVTAYEQLLTDYLRILGPDHQQTLTTRSDLAYWRGEAGDPAGAVTAFEQLLTDYLRILGPDHRQTLTTRSDLAYWRGEADDQRGSH